MKEEKESVNRETELCKMVEAAVTDETQEQKERGMIRDLLEQLQKRTEEQDVARGPIEEMQRNLDEAQNRTYEEERNLDRELWEYITMRAETNSNDFGGFLELISRFEFDFCRCGIFV